MAHENDGNGGKNGDDGFIQKISESLMHFIGNIPHTSNWIAFGISGERIL